VLHLIKQPDPGPRIVLRRRALQCAAAAADARLDLQASGEIDLHARLRGSGSALARSDVDTLRDVTSRLHAGAALAVASADREPVQAEALLRRGKRVRVAAHLDGHPGAPCF